MREMPFCLLFFLLWVSMLGLPHIASSSPLPADAIVFEAESMQPDDSGAWQVRPHYRGWYSGKPSQMSMLAGHHPGLGQATHRISIPEAGVWRLHVRYLDLLRPEKRAFQVSVSQAGGLLGDREFDLKSLRDTSAGEKRWGSGYGRFVWDSLDFTVATAGDLTISLQKTSADSSNSHVRQIDVFLLTRDLSYEPAVTDLYPLYVQVTMLPEQPKPAAVHVFVRRSHSPYYDHANINAQGLFIGASNGADNMKEAHLAPGDVSPWINLSPLLTYHERDRLILTAITGYRHEPLKTSAFEVVFSRTPDLSGVIKRQTRRGSGNGLVFSFNNVTGELITEEDGSSKNLRMAQGAPAVDGQRPQLFPVVTGMTLTPVTSMADSVAKELEALSIVGVNGVRLTSKPFVEQGFGRNLASGFYFHLTTPECVAKIDEQKLATHMAKCREDIDFEHVFAFNMMDEPGLPIDDVVKCETCKRDYVEFLRAQQLDSSLPLTDEPEAGEAFYWSMRFRIHRMTEKLRAGTLAARNAGIEVPTMVNFATEIVYSGNLVSRGADWFSVYDSGALTFGWHEDWASHSRTYQIIGYQSDVMRAACRRSGIPFGVYDILQFHPWEVQAKAFTSIGHGNQAICFFNYGPSYAITSDTNSHRPEIYPAMKKVAWTIGAVEKHLTKAKVAPADAAQLLSVTNDIWQTKTDNAFGKERIYLNLLLRHVNVRLQVLDENDLGTELDKFKTLFVSDAVVRRASVAQILDWVRRGGNLYLTAGALEYDERHQPLRLEDELGLSRQQFELTEKPGRPQFEMPRLRALAQVQGIDVVAGQQPPFLQRVSAGNGSVTSLGFFPGLSYVSRSGDLGVQANNEIYSATEFPAALRELAASWVSGRLLTDNYLLEANLLQAPEADLIVLANWTGKPMTAIVTLRQAPKYAAVKAVQAEIVEQQQVADKLIVTVRLEAGAILECQRQ